MFHNYVNCLGCVSLLCKLFWICFSHVTCLECVSPLCTLFRMFHHYVTCLGCISLLCNLLNLCDMYHQEFCNLFCCGMCFTMSGITWLVVECGSFCNLFSWGTFHSHAWVSATRFHTQLLTTTVAVNTASSYKCLPKFSVLIISIIISKLSHIFRK